MILRIALFRSPNLTRPIPSDELTEKHCADYIRVTEYVDVEFEPLSAESLKNQLHKLDAAEAMEGKSHMRVLADINRQRTIIEDAFRRDQNAPVLTLVRTDAS